MTHHHHLPTCHRFPVRGSGNHAHIIKHLRSHFHAHIWPRSYPHANAYTHKRTQSHKNPSPPAKSVCGHTLDTRTHSAGTKPKHTGEHQLWFPIWAAGCVRLCWEVTLKLQLLKLQTSLNVKQFNYSQANKKKM